MTVSAEPYIFAQRRERHPAGWPVVAILALLAVAMLPVVPEVAAQTGAAKILGIFPAQRG